MKLVLNDGSVWTAHFHHQFLSEEQAAQKPYDVITTCRLHLGTCVHAGENDACTRAGYLGISRTSKKDNFCKAYGRYVALQRLLIENKLGDKFYKELFAAYWRLSPTQALVKDIRKRYQGVAHAA